jgi:hypothetical protein
MVVDFRNQKDKQTRPPSYRKPKSWWQKAIPCVSLLYFLSYFIHEEEGRADEQLDFDEKWEKPLWSVWWVVKMLFIDIDMIISLVGIRDLLILLRAVRREDQELGVVDEVGVAQIEESGDLAQRWTSLEMSRFVCCLERTMYKHTRID